MTTFLALLTVALSTVFPSTSRTSWMRPESFQLTIGMPRPAAMSTLEHGGWQTRAGDHRDELIVDYDTDKSLTLVFRRNHLHSIRFELFMLLPEIRTAFGEEKEYLQKTLGAPKKGGAAAVLVYDRVLPNVIAVVSDDPKSEHGKRGLGVLVVRYFDPVEVR